MKDTGLKWYFLSGRNIVGRGENDPQKELFPGKPMQTLVRESIQNSLDHPGKRANGPVRVEYKIRKFSAYDFANFEELRSLHIQPCYDISHADKFECMLAAMEKEEIYFLEVADYNTTGMDYDYDTDTGNFKKFVRYTGDPNKDSGSGGSHGYGKIAYFTISEINTILVSSLTEDGICTFEGVSRLASHPAGEPHVDYLDSGLLDKGDGVPIQCREDEESIIPADFRRKKPGTTVSIPYVNLENKADLFKQCCEAVLRNFFAAINDGMLEVEIDFGEGYTFECSTENLEDIFRERFFNNPPYDVVKNTPIDKFNPYPYWLAYKNKDVIITDDMPESEAIEACVDKKYICFESNLHILGHSKLYLNRDTIHGNDLILFMRCPRMVVGAKKNSSSRGYSAIFLCDDDERGKGNELLRMMEDAAHRTWSKKQLENDKRGSEMIKQAGDIEAEMREFIQKCLDIAFPTNQTESDDVELEDFAVPMITDDGATNPLLGDLINIQGDNDDISGAPVDIHPSNTSSKKSSYVGKAQIIETKKAKKTNNQTENTGGRGKKHHVTPGQNTPSSGTQNYEENPSAKERKVRKRFVVKPRIISETTDDGVTHFTLIIHSPIQEDSAYLTLTPVGETEDNSCNVHIQSASVGIVKENEISKVPLVEGKNVITFTVDNAGEYSFSLVTEHDVIIKEDDDEN